MHLKAIQAEEAALPSGGQQHTGSSCRGSTGSAAWLMACGRKRAALLFYRSFQVFPKKKRGSSSGSSEKRKFSFSSLTRPNLGQIGLHSQTKSHLPLRGSDLNFNSVPVKHLVQHWSLSSLHCMCQQSRIINIGTYR